jgi:hypothetical protein
LHTKKLGVQFSSDRADSGLSGLSLLKPSVQFLLQVDQIQTCGWSTRNLLDPQLTTLCLFSVIGDWIVKLHWKHNVAGKNSQIFGFYRTQLKKLIPLKIGIIFTHHVTCFVSYNYGRERR